MNQATPAPQGQGGLNLTPSDIFFILFRHKTKIVLFALLGLASGATAYKFWPDKFQSNAQLLVRYVTEKRDVVDSNEDTRVTAAGGRGSEHILQTEVAILTSLDLSKIVANNIGPDRIIKDPLEEDLPIEEAAAIIINKGVVASPLSRDSTVIGISFVNDDPSITQEVLREIINVYLERHVEIHRGSGGTFDDYLTQQTDQLKAKLNQTENELLKALNRAGVRDIGKAKITLTAEIARIQQTILETEVELAENLSALNDSQPEVSTDSNSGKDVNSIAEIDENFSNAVEQYENTRTALEIFKSRERELLMSYTEANSLVAGVRNQIRESETKLKEIEESFPAVSQSKVTINSTGQTTIISDKNIQNSYKIRVKTLQAKINVLKTQLEGLEAKADRIESVEVAIHELERRKELEESNYQNFLKSLERARLEEALSSGKINNISAIQSPTPVSVALSIKLQIASGCFAAFSIIGFAWAFLVELFLDRTIKRPIDIQREIGLPLFMTIPDTQGKAFKKLTKNSSARNKQLFGKGKAAESKTKKAYTPKSSTLQAAAKSNPEYYGASNSQQTDGGEITPWDDNHPLHNYFEALRDKVIGYFESKNLQHKPKLIGLTGLGEDPGVSTVASGIASSLSKTEGGNVLLVDMTLGKESAHQFYKGKEVSNLEEALLEPHKAQLQDNLYVVAEGSNGYKLPSLLPSRFNSIIPKLKASDFDYIVFDMPAVSPISSTPRLASFMDVMLMVIESEKTNKEVVKQASELLSESKAHLGAILNKTKSYTPKQLEQDFIGLS